MYLFYKINTNKHLLLCNRAYIRLLTSHGRGRTLTSLKHHFRIE